MKLCAACGGVVAGREWHCASCEWRAPMRTGGVPCLLNTSADVVEAFTADQISNLEAVDPRHFWFAARNELIVWALTHHFPAARTVLEVGCGIGRVLGAVGRARPDLRLTGADVADSSLRIAARAAPNAELICADTRSLPYDQEFDVVGAFDVLEHIPEHGEALQAMARATTPGGGVILTVPQHPALWHPVDAYSGHHRRYTRSASLTLVREAELDVLRVTSFVSLLLPALVVSRLARRNSTPVPSREFTVSGRVNGVAMAIMRAELALIKAGVSFAAGGSLLIVARRRAA